MENKERLARTEKNFLIVAIILVSFTFLCLISNDTLIIKSDTKKLQNISEFIENQEIFHEYLDKKRDLYSELNNVLIDSSFSSNKRDSIYKYRHTSFFGGIKTWGWDSVTVDNRYNFKFVVEDIFLNDLDFWNQTIQERYKSFHGDKKKIPPDSSIDDVYNIYKHLKNYVRNDQFIYYFFSQNLELKLSFLKSIMDKYNTTLPDTISFTNYTKVKGRELKRYIFSFFNDSTNFNTAFTFYTELSFIDRIYDDLKVFDNYHSVQKTYKESILKIYNNYVADKFLIYDKNVFSERLPYSSYISNIRKIQQDLNFRLRNVEPTKSSITTPVLHIDFNILIIYKICFWFIFILIYLLRNITLYHKDLIQKLSSTKTDEIPNILNMLLLFFKNKSRSVNMLFYIIISTCVLSLILFIHLPYFEVIYESVIYSIVQFFLPLSLILFSSIFKIKDNKVTLCEYK